MEAPADGGSARRREHLDAAYRYVLDHGLADLSLRPLAAAIGSGPRVLLFLFGSKDGLVAALLARARGRAGRPRARAARGATGGPSAATEAIWAWLAAPDTARC
jgi:AcrR family transcriptional regulator